MQSDKFKELLARARATVAEMEKQKLLETEQFMEENKIEEVELPSHLQKVEAEGATEGEKDAAEDAAVEFIREIHSSGSELLPGATEKSSLPGDETSQQQSGRVLGVAREITLNTNQQRFNDTVLQGRDTILIGAAGTGKTTATGKTTKNLIAAGTIKALGQSTKWLRAGSPGVVVVSYTRKAVNNIRHAVADEIKPHVLTIHKLIEFAPVKYEIEDPARPGEFKMTMRFEPKRNEHNPLPPDLKLIIFEESSMISVELYQQLKLAMPHQHQEIFLGDLQQLPPIFGMAILGFKLLELPVVELTEVYRQALKSPIISLAWKILEGNPHDFSSTVEKFKNELGNTRIRVPALDKFTKAVYDEPDRDAGETTPKLVGEVKIQVWQKQLSSDHGLITAVKQFNVWGDSGYYNPDRDIILMPFNKAFGTIELNKGIQQHLGNKRGAVVHEIIAGFAKCYFAVGDRVLYDKEDAYIVDIIPNPDYLGKRPQHASKYLDRWGHLQKPMTEQEKLDAQSEDAEMSTEAIERLMAAAVESTDERVNAASHLVLIRYTYQDEFEEPIELKSAAEVKDLLGGNALTVHKFQGSEEARVFLVFHNTHSVMVQREMLYTAVTRASKFLHIICEPNTFEKGVKSQRIKGSTLAEKAEFFKGKKDIYDEKTKAPDLPSVEFQPGVYAGEKATASAIAMEASAKPAKLVKLADLVPEHIKQQYLDFLRRSWSKAKNIWGDEIGEVPSLSFNLQRAGTLGTANFQQHQIKLNPVWCILSGEPTEAGAVIGREMRDITIPHEICHLVAGRYSKDFRHGEGWIMAMKLMGLPPEKTYTGDTLPPWMEGYRQIVEKELAKLKESDNVDTTEEPLDDGDEA